MERQREKIAIGTMVLECLLSNYGSFFQHFALRKFLANAGYSSCRLPHDAEIMAHKTDGIGRAIIRLIAHKIGDIFHILGIRRRQEGFSLYENARRAKKLRLFKKDYKRLIGALYEPYAIECPIRVYGSDQIWSSLEGLSIFPSLIEKNRCERLLTYAVSGDWEFAKSREWQELAKRVLPSFDNISVREETGVKMIQSIISTKVEHVVDPTLLMNRPDYEAVIGSEELFRVPTLFCYLLNLKRDGCKTVKYVENFSSANEVELKICGIQGAEKCVTQKQLFLFSPTEFLRAYRDAQYIVTNSFHGIVFALIFGKPFLAIKQECDAGSNQNMRQIELLSRLGLSERLVEIVDVPWRLNDLISMKPSYDYFTFEFKEWIKQSGEWLLDALKAKK